MDAYISKPIQPAEFFKVVEGFGFPPESRPIGRPREDVTQKRDPSSLVERFGGDVKLARKLIGIFLRDLPRMRSMIRKNVIAQDMDSLASAAHALKGAVGNFGANEVVEKARWVEGAARRGDIHGAAEACKEMEKQLSVMAKWLQSDKTLFPRARAARIAGPSAKRGKVS
jgi:two-component system, sensor histidine kinase and response regulator